MRIGSSRVEQPARRGEISDDDEEECQQGGGICPSCRLAVNKDTGRLKWCMGGNDIWRTRIRFMLLIPAVILPVTIIIIVLSKSTVIGKLSMSNYEHAPTASPLTADQQPRSNFIPGAHDDIEHIAVADRLLHPDVETSFIPVESLIASRALHRHKRDMKQAADAGSTTGQPDSIQPRPSKSRSATHSAAATVKSQLLQELQVNFSRRPMQLVPINRKVPGADCGRLADDCDEDGEDEEEADDDDEEEEDEEEEAEEGKMGSNEDSSASQSEDGGEEDEEEEQAIEEVKAALHWAGRSASGPFDVDGTRLEDDDSASYGGKDESLDYRSFWKGDWNEDFIRKAQAKMMSKYMDKSVNPCQDFYQYSCGNWDKYNSIPEDKAGYDTFEALRESLDVVLKQLLEEPVTQEEASTASAIVKAKHLFKSCMNYEILEQRMEKPLLELLDELGGWPILKSNWDPDKFDWLLLIANLRLFNNDILISEGVGPDIKNSDQYVIQFDQTTLGLPTKDYFLRPANAIYLMAYKNYLITVASLLGASMRNTRIQADEIIQFEIKLAEITISPHEKRNSSDLYKRVTVEELHVLIPQIDWHRYLSIVLARPVNLSEPVVLFATKYLQDLVKLISQTPSRAVANYLLWRFVRHRVNNLDDRFQEAKQTFYYILYGREKSPPRWKNCVAQVNSNMGLAVGSIFVKKYFDEISKNDTLYMTHEIQHAFRELLNESSWLDSVTKQVASEKVEAMHLRIGYPDFILLNQELNKRYKDVTIHPDKYFENTLNILRHLTRVEQDRLGSPVNKTQWNAPPAIVNAYYSRNKNQIMFPAGILQPPFYHRYFPRSLNYGGIGVVIGHEITHGFDDKGRLFDKYGNLHQWWSDETINEFDQRASCLIDQYSKYVVKEVSMKIDGLNTQGENIADNGGIKQAFRAYEKWLSQNGDVNESLPGIEATSRQLFFINFAQVWCGSMRPEAMKNKLKTTVHPPGKYRLIGTLSNFEDFAKVFQCPLGSPMNPEKKCLVW